MRDPGMRSPECYGVVRGKSTCLMTYVGADGVAKTVPGADYVPWSSRSCCGT